MPSYRCPVPCAPAATPASAMRSCRARVRIASSSALFAAASTGTARPPAWRKPGDLERAGVERGIGDVDGDPVDGAVAADAAPAGDQEARERVGALDRQERQHVERGLPEEAVDRHLAVGLVAVAEQVEEALVADLVLGVAPLLRPLLLQLGVAVAAGKHAQRGDRQADCTHVRSRAGGVLWHPRRVCKVKPAARQVQSGTAPPEPLWQSCIIAGSKRLRSRHLLDHRRADGR